MHPTEPMEDDRIVDLYWERDERAIAATSRKYGSYCRAIAMHILDAPEEAEEYGGRRGTPCRRSARQDWRCF